MKAKSVNESLGDILKPKERDEITRELNKWAPVQKLDAIKDFFYNKEGLIRALGESGIDDDIIKDAFLSQSSRDELEEMVSELLDYNTDSTTEFLLEFFLGYIDENKLEKVAQLIMYDQYGYIRKELKEVLDDIIIKHIDIIREIEPTTDEDTWA